MSSISDRLRSFLFNTPTRVFIEATAKEHIWVLIDTDNKIFDFELEVSNEPPFVCPRMCNAVEFSTFEDLCVHLKYCKCNNGFKRCKVMHSWGIYKHRICGIYNCGGIYFHDTHGNDDVAIPIRDRHIVISTRKFSYTYTNSSRCKNLKPFPYKKYIIIKPEYMYDLFDQYTTLAPSPIIIRSPDTLHLAINEEKKEEIIDEVGLEHDKLCVVCMENKTKIIFNCRHFVCCNSCSKELRLCPICRKDISSRDRVFD